MRLQRLALIAAIVLVAIVPAAASGAPLAQSGPTVADCDAVYGYFRAYEGYVVEYDTVEPLLASLAEGGYADQEVLQGYASRFGYLEDLHASVTPPWQLQDFHTNVIGLYYNAEGAFQNFDVAIHGGFMATIFGPDEATGRANAFRYAQEFAYEAGRLRGLVSETATGWMSACAVYNG